MQKQPGGEGYPLGGGRKASVRADGSDATRSEAIRRRRRHRTGRHRLIPITDDEYAAALNAHRADLDAAPCLPSVALPVAAGLGLLPPSTIAELEAAVRDAITRASQDGTPPTSRAVWLLCRAAGIRYRRKDALRVVRSFLGPLASRGEA